MYLGVELLGHMGVPFSVFWEISRVFHSGCTSLHSQQRCQQSMRARSPHACSHLLCVFFLEKPFWQGWGDISLSFQFAFSICLVRFSIFSCACWPSACPFCKKNLLRSSALFRNRAVYCFWCWVAWAVYRFWMLTCYWSYHLQIFFPI